jgi:hypothetical protein
VPRSRCARPCATCHGVGAIVIRALPTPLANEIEKFTPGHIGVAVVSLHMVRETLAPWTGLLVLLGYAVLPLVIGGVLPVRRDA